MIDSSKRLPVLLLAFAFLGVAGCATPQGEGEPATAEAAEAPPSRQESEQPSFWRNLSNRVASVGVKVESSLARVFDRNQRSKNLGPATECTDTAGGSSLVVESGVNEPDESRPGGVFRNTMIVHLCIPQGETRQVVHTLNVIYQGKVVVYKGKSFANNNLARSRQALYTVVDVSPKAPAGEYETETTITVAGKSFKSRTPFRVIASD